MGRVSLFYGMPAKWNPEGSAFVDAGLGGYLKEAGYKPSQYGREMGKFEVPMLRNVDKRPSPDLVKAFGPVPSTDEGLFPE